MALYRYGGIYDFLQDVHFPKKKKPVNVSEPWYWYLERQNPTYFSFLGNTWGPGWGARHILPVIKILAVDTQPETPTEFVGATSLEDAADTYIQRWDSAGPSGRLDDLFFGRISFGDPFFWKVLGKKFPKWITGFKDGLMKSRVGDPNPPAETYIKNATTLFYQKWNEASRAYSDHSLSVPPDGGGFLPITSHGFAIPFPHPTVKEGGNVSGLLKQLDEQRAWFGPIPQTAWVNINLINTQSYAFTFGFGQLDAKRWDLSTWPPRRTTTLQIHGGTKNPPSAISGRWGGNDPFISFTDHQFPLL